MANQRIRDDECERVLAFLVTYAASHDYSPTYAEIADGSRLTSTSRVGPALAELQRDGLISWTPTIARSVRLKQPVSA